MDTMMDLFSFFFWWTESSKEQHLFELENFYNIINIFTITFDQFNAWIPE